MSDWWQAVRWPAFAASPEAMAVGIFGFGPAALALYVCLAVLFWRERRGGRPAGRRAIGLFLMGSPLALLAGLIVDRPVAGLPVGDLGFALLALLALSAPLEIVWHARGQAASWRRARLALLPGVILACWFLFAVTAESSRAV